MCVYISYGEFVFGGVILGWNYSTEGFPRTRNQGPGRAWVRALGYLPSERNTQITRAWWSKGADNGSGELLRVPIGARLVRLDAPPSAPPSIRDNVLRSPTA